jgi:hypothetical protein
MLDVNLKKINLDGDASPSKESIINNSSQDSKKTMINKLLPFLIVIILGVGTGFIGHSIFPWSAKATSGGTTQNQAGAVTGLKVGDIIGIEDVGEADEAMGVLQSGGFEGEGSHRLVRPGGADQTVYLTSSVVDLDQFVGHKITIWGDTFSAQKAGWLMDVVKVRLEELNAQTEE